MHILFNVGIIIISGLIMAKVVSFIKLPHITGYLLAGILIGPSVLGIIPHEHATNLIIISEIALGFIAYTIGSEFNFYNLKSTGKSIIVITLFQAFAAVILVDLAMIFIFRQKVYFSIVLGAIATATAPGPILMVIKQYKAKGPLVETLLPLVALDDALGILIFGICLSIASTLANASETLSVVYMILEPIKEIMISIILGGIIGGILSIVINKVRNEEILLSSVVSSILVGIGLTHRFHASSILLCMTIGATVSNIVPAMKNIRNLHRTEKFTSPFLILFFTVAGVELNLTSVWEVGVIGLGYVVIRAIGKIVGCNVGARIAKSPLCVQKYLGYTLIPQAGVAIGLALIAKSTLPEPYGEKTKTIILAGTVIYELIGPLVAKIAMVKAGEIKEICDDKRLQKV